jgi:hypothetical protein
MATEQYTLANPPSEPRARELWLQHAAGFILFEDVRKYALERIDSNLSPEAIGAAQKAVDDALYGLMMIVDGVSGGASNADYNVFINFIVHLAKRSNSKNNESSELDLREGTECAWAIMAGSTAISANSRS